MEGSMFSARSLLSLLTMVLMASTMPEIALPEGDCSANSALRFDGRDDIVIFGSMATPDTYTIEAWARPDGRLDRGAIVGISTGPESVCGFGMGLSITSGSPCHLVDELGCRNGLTLCAQQLPSTKWIHVAGTFDSGTVRLYVNGDLVEERLGMPFDPSTWLAAGAMVFKGGNQAHFAGDLDEIRIWDFARTQAEIQATMSMPLTGDEEGLVGYWPLDEGRGNSAADRTGSGVTGTLRGPQWVASAAPFCPGATPDVDDVTASAQPNAEHIRQKPPLTVQEVFSAMPEYEGSDIVRLSKQVLWLRNQVGGTQIVGRMLRFPLALNNIQVTPVYPESGDEITFRADLFFRMPVTAFDPEDEAWAPFIETDKGVLVLWNLGGQVGVRAGILPDYSSRILGPLALKGLGDDAVEALESWERNGRSLDFVVTVNASFVFEPQLEWGLLPMHLFNPDLYSGEKTSLYLFKGKPGVGVRICDLNFLLKPFEEIGVSYPENFRMSWSGNWPWNALPCE
jgi:hypothetical protein